MDNRLTLSPAIKNKAKISRLQLLPSLAFDIVWSVHSSNLTVQYLIPAQLGAVLSCPSQCLILFYGIK